MLEQVLEGEGWEVQDAGARARPQKSAGPVREPTPDSGKPVAEGGLFSRAPTTSRGVTARRGMRKGMRDTAFGSKGTQASRPSPLTHRCFPPKQKGTRFWNL